MTWYDTNYLYKKQMTQDHTKNGGSDSSNFPVLVSITDTDLKTVGNGGKVRNSSGYDIIFVNSAENALLNWELLSYTPTTGNLIAYVMLSTLSHTADNLFYMYFDNTTISTFQGNTNATWNSNFKGVWHQEEISGTTNADSTSNAATATKQSAGHPASISGQVGNALSFNGSSDFETVSSSAPQITGDKTIIGWFNITSFTYPGGIAPRIIFCNVDGTNAFQLCVLNNTGANGNFNNFGWFVNDSSGQHAIGGGTDLSTSTRYRVAAVYVASSHAVTLDVNASSVSGNNASGFGTASNDGKLYIGERQDASGLYSGGTDELFILATAVSADWITADYNNQSSPSTFITEGSLISQVTTSTRTVPATAALLQTSTRTISTSTALEQTSTRTITATAALELTSTRTIPCTAALELTSSRTISSSAALELTSTRTVPCATALELTSIRTIPCATALELTSSRTVPCTASLSNTIRTIPSTAALEQTSTRTISCSSALELTSTRTVPCTSALEITSTRTVPCTASLSNTIRTIPCTAAISVAAPTTNAIFYVRSGNATFYVRGA